MKSLMIPSWIATVVLWCTEVYRRAVRTELIVVVLAYVLLLLYSTPTAR